MSDNFFPAVLSILADADEDTVNQPNKRSPAEAKAFGRELVARANTITEIKATIREKMESVNAEIEDVNDALKEKETAIHELKMTKIAKHQELFELHDQLQKQDDEIEQMKPVMASLISEIMKNNMNKGRDSQGQGTVNQLDTNVGTSSGTSEQDVSAIIDNSDAK